MMNIHPNPNTSAPVHSGDGQSAPTGAPIPSTAAPRPACPAPSSPSQAERLARQAQQWAKHALGASRMHAGTVYDKALSSLLFCLDERARDFAVPTKLSGTSKHQLALRRLVQTNPHAGHPLTTCEEDGEVTARFEGHLLGSVQSKHLPWLRPLLSAGARVRFLAVSGTTRDEGYLGCNVALSGIGAALPRLEAGTPAPLTSGEDVYLWRTLSGEARATVEPAGRHSGSPEWGYGGSGPADLAYAILLRYASPLDAEAHYQRFKEDVSPACPLGAA